MTGRDLVVVIGVAVAVFLVLRAIRGGCDLRADGPPARVQRPSPPPVVRESAESVLRRAFGDGPVGSSDQRQESTDGEVQ